MPRVSSGMHRKGQFGRRVPATRYSSCFNCDTETVQWLWSVQLSSPGSYRGTRLISEYACSECGEIA